ncbi:MAG: EAL domain-containing protein, partial [Epsilonproteobacteria bacterium]|nr:EAL domain-containing protein [Campylobacterota bacterium]
AMYAMALFALFIVREYIPLQNFYIIFFMHTAVFLYRAYYLREYKKVRESISDKRTLEYWVYIFKTGPILAGLAWGSLLFFFDNVPLSYNLLILMMIVGLAAIGMATLGAIFAVYLSFMIPMMTLVMAWMLIHLYDDNIFMIMVVPFLVMIIYLFISARRFSMNYMKSFTEESRANLLNERMELALDGSSTAILDWNMKTNELFISESWKELLGYSSEELPNKVNVWREQLHPDDKKALFISLREHFRKKSVIFESTHRLRCKDGSYIWVFGRALLLYDNNEHPYRIIGTHTDITKRKRAEADVIEKKRLLEESQRLAHIGSWKLDFASNSLEWSAEIYRIFEVDSDIPASYELFMDRVHPDDREAVDTAYRESLKNCEPYEITHRLLFDDKRIKYVKEKCETTFDREGNALVSIGTAQDITQQKLLENMLQEQKEILSHLAHHDTLTELPNRILLHDRLHQTIQKAKRANRKFAVLFIDLDHFKEINDSLGHDVGDEVLQEIAQRFESLIRKEDTLARLGGDEFTIIMQNLKEEQDASILAQKLLSSLQEPIIKKENLLYLSCSIGISLYPADGTSVQNLLKYADAAMYRAKEEGRSNFQFYSSEMTTLAFERIVMEASMRKGLQNKEFMVYYQPQVNAKRNEVVGMEALVRWKHPEMGMVFPSKFIPLAESTGLIIQLDRYVMKTAMQQMSKWYEDGLNPGILAMNLSIRQFKQKDFLEFLQRTLQETGCKAEWVELEVTESEIMQDTQEAIIILTQLHDLGVMIAIDDFGTGYSSLSYLKKLPIDKLKIDQSFVHNLPADEEDGAIIEAVIALANALKLSIIAEGVEQKEQKDFILQSGCENIQGFYYSEAVEEKTMTQILEEGIRTS